jgi:MFS family permease
MERPFGVTLLAILAIIDALMAFGTASMVGFMFGMMESMIPGGAGGIFAGIGMIIAGVAVIFGLIYLLLAWGLWTGKGWAWTVMMIFSILGLIGGIISLIAFVGIVPLIINILILYYLTRPHVKAFFGKGPPPEGPPPPPPP